MIYPFEGTIKMETVKDEEGKDKIVWSQVEPRTEWARLDKDNNLVHLDMDLCAQGPANAYTALAIGVWNAAVKAEREACAKKAETLGVHPALNVFAGGPDWYKHGKEIATAIRNRGNT
jgi:hypothetical protein